MSVYTISLFSFIFALIIILGVGSLIIKFSISIGLVNVPFQSKHNINPNSTPLAGGILIFFSFFVTVILGFLVNHSLITDFSLAILISGTVILIFGVWDDFVGLSAKTKFAGQLIATMILVIFGNSVQIFNQAWLNIPLTFLWLIGITNAYNLMDSREGIVNGISINTLIALTIASFIADQYELIFISMTLLGTCVGMKFFNSIPGKTFLGDSGAQTLGFLTAALAMEYNPIGYDQTASWFLPILLFAIPLIDTSCVVLYRLKNKKNIFKGDTNHTFHRLSRMFSDQEAVNIMVILSILYDALAFLLLEINSQISSILFVCIVVVTVFTSYQLINHDPGADQSNINSI